jgi:hypothetical protein
VIGKIASPVIAGGKLYVAREDRIIFVARVQNKFEVLAENRMGEQVIASPVAISNSSPATRPVTHGTSTT